MHHDVVLLVSMIDTRMRFERYGALFFEFDVANQRPRQRESALNPAVLCDERERMTDVTSTYFLNWLIF